MNEEKKKSKKHYKSKSVLIFDEDSEVVGVMRSARATVRFADLLSGVSAQSISLACRGKITSLKGHYFRYVHNDCKTFAVNFEEIQLQGYDNLYYANMRYISARERSRRVKQAKNNHEDE